MVHVYYHIYSFYNNDNYPIIEEQLDLIEKYFNFPFILNIVICLAEESSNSSTKLFDRLNKTKKPNYIIRDVKTQCNEFATLELIEKDKQKFANDDLIFYLHTKGVSRMRTDYVYKKVITWRQMLNYFNIEKVNFVFDIFKNTNYNTYGVLLTNILTDREDNQKLLTFYSGNFWWMKAEYAKTININDVEKNRYNAETCFIQCGENWKPYSAYNVSENNHYNIEFKREEYAK